MAQPQKKAPIKKKATVNDLKAKMGFGVTVDKGKIQGASNADKPMDWLLMPKAFQDAIKLPGFPIGYVSTICGHSNTGKSTLVKFIVAALDIDEQNDVCYVAYTGKAANVLKEKGCPNTMTTQLPPPFHLLTDQKKAQSKHFLHHESSQPPQHKYHHCFLHH